MWEEPICCAWPAAGGALPVNVGAPVEARAYRFLVFARAVHPVFQQFPGGDIQAISDALQRIDLDIAPTAFEGVDHLARKADHQAEACLGDSHLLACAAKVFAQNARKGPRDVGTLRFVDSMRHGALRFDASRLVELVAVRLAHFFDGTVHAQVALFDPDGALADALDLLDGVGDEQYRDVAGFDEMLDALLAFLLEEDVAYRERLVDDQDVGFGDGGDGKGDAGHHAAGVILERHIHKVVKLGKINDLVQVLVDELLGVAQKRAVEIDVLTGRELHVKTGAQLDERRDVAAHDAFALAGFQHAGNHLEHGGLARAVGAHKAHDVAAAYLEADVLERAELLEEQLVFHELDEVFLEVVELLGGHVENHGDVVDFDGVLLGRCRGVAYI